MRNLRKWLLFAVAGLLALVIAGYQRHDAGARGPDVDRALAAQERHTPSLLNVRGVAGTGVGLDARGEAVVRVYVEAPGIAGIPSVLDSVPTDVVVTGMFVARCDPQTKCPRPVPIGVSTGHPDITAGTIGARVTDGASVFALSNNHVYANMNNASIGDSALQPGTFDGGTDPGDKIGELASFEPIKFDGSNNLMDAAIAVTSTGNVGTATPPDGYGTPSGGIIGCTSNCTNLLNLQVKKYGRTTALTTGTVSEVNVTVNVCYEVRAIFCIKSARFVDQIAVGSGSFSAGGDSGSLIVTQSGHDGVALLFAGSSARTLGNRIDLVLNRFGVSIDGGAAPTATPTATTTAISSTNTPTATGTSAPTTNTPTATATATSVPSGIILNVVAYKVRGLQKADLTWSGANLASVDIFRKNGSAAFAKIVTTDNDGAHTDNINVKGGGTYTYRLCEAGTSTCSQDVVITY